MSWKNKLQEVYQKRQLPLPVYTITSLIINNSPHFISHVRVYDNSNVFTGKAFPNKKDAMSDSARLAYNELYNKYFSTIKIIDLETIPYFNKEIEEDVLYIGWVSQDNVKYYDNWYQPSNTNICIISKVSNIILYVIDPDSINYCMTMMIPHIISYIKWLNVNIMVKILSTNRNREYTCKCLDLESVIQKVDHLLS